VTIGSRTSEQPSARLQRPISRRILLGRAATLGVSIPAAAVLLAACGGDDESATPTVAAGATATTDTDVSTATGAAAQPTDSAPTEPSGEAIEETWLDFEIEPAAHEGGILIEGMVTDFEHPYIIAGEIRYGILEGLVELHPETAEPLPALATGWEASDDGLVWTFQLREGVVWHDGESFDADDVVFTHARFFRADTWFQERFGQTEALDPFTIQITMNQAYADTLVWLYGTVLAEHVLGDISDDEAEVYWDHPAGTGSDPAMVVGTGPFKLKEMVPGDHMTVVRHEEYWAGRPHLEEIIFKAVPDMDALFTQLRTGEVDFAGSNYTGTTLDPAGIAAIEGSDVELRVFPGIGYLFVALNHNPEITTLFEDPRVRQALLYALDREVLVESILFGYGEVAHGVIAPAFGYDQAQVEPQYGFDPDQARALLDEAGWLESSDGVREKDGERLSFPLLIRGVAAFEGYAAAIQEFWRAIGVEAEIDLQQESIYFEQFADNLDYVALIAEYTSALDLLPAFGCAQEGNRFGYCNPTATGVMEEASVEVDRDVRFELLTEIQNMMMEDVAILPLAYPTSIGAVNPRVHNVYLSAINSRFNMETWWVDA
jgi:peptide/nickel transport system substrate-binding protein